MYYIQIIKNFGHQVGNKKSCIILYLLNVITETIQVTESRKHFPGGQHVSQPWYK